MQILPQGFYARFRAGTGAEYPVKPHGFEPFFHFRKVLFSHHDIAPYIKENIL
jgi:hypothetical protein